MHGLKETSGISPPVRAEISGTLGPEIHQKRYRLARRVYACRAQCVVVFLDARRDRYYGLGGVDILRLFDLVCGFSDTDQPLRESAEPPIDPERLERLANTLVGRGLLCDRGDEGGDDEGAQKDGRRLASPQIDPPQLRAPDNRSPQLLDLTNFLVACLRAAWCLQWSSLGDIASRVTRARGEEAPSALQANIELARVFQRLRRWFFSEKNRCLFSSLSLIYFLQSYGHFPHFVIGVQTAPFAAHAWVQKDRIVLNGDAEIVGHFTPILVA